MRNPFWQHPQQVFLCRVNGFDPYFFPQLLLRTPLLPSDQQPDPEELLGKPFFRSAIFLASPDFYRALEKKDFSLDDLSSKEWLTLGKYINRMQFRPTPFGLFAANSICSWADLNPIKMSRVLATSLVLNPLYTQVLKRQESTRHTEGRFYLNPTIYRCGDQYRYLAADENRGRKTEYRLQAVTANAFTSALLSSCVRGINSPDLEQLIRDITGGDEQAARSWILKLLEQGMLRHESWPGINFTERSEETAFARPAEYRFDPFQSLDTIPGRFKDELRLAGFEGDLFMLNSQRECSGGLPLKYRNALERAARALRVLKIPDRIPALENFSREFAERFGDREVPLMYALDPDTGLNYAGLTNCGDTRPMYKRRAAARETCLYDPGLRGMLLSKWLEAMGADRVIRLNDGDLEIFSSAETKQAPGISILFRLFNGQLLVEQAGGASSTSMAARLGSGSTAMAGLLKELAEAEEMANPNIRFADILHFSGGKDDTINFRPALFTNEIPVSAASGLQAEQQFPPSCLMVSVRHGRILLRPENDSKYIIPRLCSAYNYARDRTPVYRFLCDLQYQDLEFNLSFRFEEIFPGQAFYPRVEFGDIILSPACWRPALSLNRQILRGSAEETAGALREYADKHKMPRFLSFGSGDQTIFIDITNDADIGLLTGSIVKNRQIVFREAPARDIGGVHDGNGNRYAAQYAAFMLNRQGSYTHIPQPRPAAIWKQAVCPPGSEWLSLKIYCSPATAGPLLTGLIFPFVKQQQGIDKWFFIRYYDPGFHIRLRLNADPASCSEILLHLKGALKEYTCNGLIHKIETDTYTPEYTRYSPPGIMEAEHQFFLGSQLAATLLPFNDLKTELESAMLLVMEIMEAIRPTNAERSLFLQKYCEDLAGGPGRLDKDMLSKVLREHQAYLRRAEELKHSLPGKMALIVKHLSAIAGKYPADELYEFQSSVIHMQLNRMFSADFRNRELICCYCLHKYFHSLHCRTLSSVSACLQ